MKLINKLELKNNIKKCDNRKIIYLEFISNVKDIFLWLL